MREELHARGDADDFDDAQEEGECPHCDGSRRKPQIEEAPSRVYGGCGGGPGPACPR